MSKRHIINKPFADADMNPRCSVCNKGTSHLFKGVRFCAVHHPDPGPHIFSQKKADAA